MSGAYDKFSGRELLESVLDTLTETGNGATDEMYQQADSDLFEFRDKHLKPLLDDREGRDDRMYQSGHNRAMAGMLGFVLRELYQERQPDDWQLEVVRLQKERFEAVNALRDICAKFGDNDWSDDLHLGDVVDKHLGRHLVTP